MSTLEVHEIATLFPTMASVDAEQLRESILKAGQLEEILVFEGKILDGRHRYEACLALGVEPRVREFEGTPQEAFSYSVALNLSRRHLTTVQRAAAGAGIKEFQAKLMGGDLEDVKTDAVSGEAEETESGESELGQASDFAANPSGDASDDAGDSENESDSSDAPAPAAPKRKKGPSARTINAKARAIASKRVGVSPRAIDTAAKIKEQAPDVFQRMLEGTAGSMPEAKRVTALPEAQRQKVYELVDEGTKIKAALSQVAPPKVAPEGPVFLGKVVLEPEQARAFKAIIEERGIKRADAGREALLDWIAKHSGSSVESKQLVGAV
jgi:ParB-like chromosome segregation protein Spo0J